MRNLTTLLVICSLCACSSGDEGPRRQVVLVSLDTLRADHMSAYGYGLPTTPHLARIAAEEAVLFERAYSQASWTLPSQTSMFTSLYPEVHQVLNPSSRLNRDVVTLPELLRDAGLDTAAFTDGGFLSREYGFAEGFDEYWDSDDMGTDELRGLDRKFDQITSWLRDHRDRDFFLFLHTYEIHAPYESDEPFFSDFVRAGEAEGDPAPLEYLRDLEECGYFKLERFANLEELVGAYDGGIAWVDDTVGRLVAEMKAMHLWDDVLVVFTSDHGESLMDRGIYAGHGAFLHDGEVHVPLIAKYPAGRHAGRRVDALVESIDIMPTILSVLGVRPRPGMVLQGHDLTPLLEGEPDPSPFAFSSFAALQDRSVRTPDWTYIGPSEETNAQDFVRGHLKPHATDPEAILRRIPRGEELWPAPGASAAPAGRDEAARWLSGAVREWQRGQDRLRELIGGSESSGELSPELTEQLKRLGYL